MKVTVRFSGILAQRIGSPRLQVTLPPPATVQDLLRHLHNTFPQLAAELNRAVIVVGGVHQSETALLENGQEVALLMPVAGG